jgi:hypothetical protein
LTIKKGKPQRRGWLAFVKMTFVWPWAQAIGGIVLASRVRPPLGRPLSTFDSHWVQLKVEDPFLSRLQRQAVLGQERHQSFGTRLSLVSYYDLVSPDRNMPLMTRPERFEVLTLFGLLRVKRTFFTLQGWSMRLCVFGLFARFK